ncbi:hypothetical protein CMI37_28515 [Candidatus Pacearchaeota archaeon]|nr:hypothetical protein [Candidatus Pacearchaeota archaeon]|tara:strand:- start:1164 stop:1820 length:657 start_codon:yes stop_codon:yes gene_type:complete
MKISAVIVAKKESKRLPNKNMLPFGNSTILGHKILQLSKCKKIDEVVVGSNCEEILNYSDSLGARTARRPDEYCDEDNCSANSMIWNMCCLIETDVVVWAHCTNPLIKPRTYDNAVECFLTRGHNDSLLSVDILQEHIWSEESKPLNYNPWQGRHPLAKELPKMYKQNGAIFIQKHKQMKENRYFFGKKPYLFVTPEAESIDINTERDYRISKFFKIN